MKDIVAAIIAQPNRENTTVVITGPETYPLRAELARLGLRWIDKAWRGQLTPAVRDYLNNKGVQLGSPSAAPVPSYQKSPAGSNWFQQQKSQTPSDLQPKSKIWYLATIVSYEDFLPGTPIVVSKNPNGQQWDGISYVDRWGAIDDKILLTNEEVKVAIKSVRDANNKPVSGPDPYALLNQATGDDKDLGPIQEEKSQKGRIPEDKISPYQKATETTFTTTNKSIMMSALAGSGKTSMLRHLASFKKPQEKWLYLVFNKKNQIEASQGSKAFPPGVEVATSHSFLGRVLGSSSEMNMLPKTDIWNEKGERINSILDDEMENDVSFPRSLKYAAKKAIKQIASLSKAFAVNPQSNTAIQEISNIIQQYGIDTAFDGDVDYKKELLTTTLDVLNKCLPGQAPLQYRKFRDHDDTLWYAAISNVSWPKFDVVLADEVQDFNRCQVVMLKKLSEAGARIVAVGDKNQAIYAFRGADSKAFDSVSQTVMGVPAGAANHELPANYRSGKKIIEYVRNNTKVSNLQAGLNFDGKVTEGMSYSDAAASLVEEWQKNGELSEPTAIIARTNKPLVNSALDLMKNDMDFVIIGRDFSKELIDHMNKVLGSGRYKQIVDLNNLPGRLDQYANGIANKWASKISKASELKEIQETTESLQYIINNLVVNGGIDRKTNFKVTNSDNFIEYIRKRFAGIDVDSVSGAEQYKNMNPRKFVTLTTAHRSKGLEFDRVFIKGRELFPHPKAKTPDELDQEDNALYVALTRAMKELHVLAPEPPPS